MNQRGRCCGNHGNYFSLPRVRGGGWGGGGGGGGGIGGMHDIQLDEWKIRREAGCNDTRSLREGDS